ncbi:hypothetical protein [Faecalibacterium prausnitzii]|uniref:hypothetical protein n=1 Tax=Faecalibacterium prausnitzii TaxID=853 RepID=UPI00130DBF88|nr:hypothetical protein [Faecalibacterium prausnitzii]
MSVSFRLDAESPLFCAISGLRRPVESYPACQSLPLWGNGDDRRLRHIGNAPVHWHEETFSSGGILLSDENATVFLTSSDLQPVAPTQIATLNAICFFFDHIKIFQASIPRAERISYTVLFHALPV